MDKNQSQGIYIDGLSQFSPSLGWKPIGLYSFCRDQKAWLLVEDKLTARLEKVPQLI